NIAAPIERRQTRFDLRKRHAQARVGEHPAVTARGQHAGAYGVTLAAIWLVPDRSELPMVALLPGGELFWGSIHGAVGHYDQLELVGLAIEVCQGSFDVGVDLFLFVVDGDDDGEEQGRHALRITWGPVSWRGRQGGLWAAPWPRLAPGRPL